MTKKVCIIGSGPLPNAPEGIREAAGLRTEQFVSPVLKAGHTILLVCIYNTLDTSFEERKEGITILHISRTDATLLRQIRHAMSLFCPDVIIGVNTFPSYIASKIKPKKTPLWSDLNGWIIAESQIRGWTEKTDTHFANAWRQEKKIITSSDMISTVSEAQKFCTIGELTALGQIRHDNTLEKRVISIQNCTKWFDTDKSHMSFVVNSRVRHDFDKIDKNVHTLSSEEITGNMFIFKKKTIQTKNVEVTRKTLLYREKKEDTDKEDNTDNSMIPSCLLRGKMVPNDAFVITWIGGYNNWVDEKTLFEALEIAMSKVSHLYFVSTGGAIAKVAHDTFGRFRQRIDMSKFKHRFIFLGWIATPDMKKVYAESNVGISVDIDCLETQTGARNRLNEMMKFGLPVITTQGSEIASIISKYKTGIVSPSGNATMLCDAIITLVNLSKEEREDISQRGQRLIFDTLNEDKIMQPLLDFIENPILADKRSIPIEGWWLLVQNALWYAKKNGIRSLWNKWIQLIS